MTNIPGINVPAVSWGDLGFQAPSPPLVLAGVQLDWNSAFNKPLSYQLTTPQGQLSSSEAALINYFNGLFVYYTNQVDPAYASGRMQDAICRINDIERFPAEPTVIQVACVGVQGVGIPVGSLVKDSSGNVYSSTLAGTIPVGGTITLPFANLTPGPISVPGAVTIYGSIPQWDSVSVVSGILGQNTETRQALEARRQQSIEKNSVGALAAIQGSVLALPGVLDCYVTENTSSSPVTLLGATLAAKSLYVAVTGGVAADIATAIWKKKAPGCAYNGNTTVTVYDTSPAYLPPLPSYQVSFEIPPALQFVFAVSIVNGPLVPSNATTLIQNAIVSAFAGGDGGPRAKTGSKVLANRFIAPVAALGPWAQVASILIGTNNTPGAVFAGTIVGTALTSASPASGTIAVGQTISDPNGLIIPGTTIVSGSGSSWVVGNSQTVAGASFTGSGSGTNLTTSVVTGTIRPGDTLAGTGVPANTTIVSQTSGTPGGAGVYVTFGATTASTAALTSKPTITGVAATLNSVQVNINQEPAVIAADIQVALV